MNPNSLQEVIAKLEKLFSEFNEHFFDGKLEAPVIAVSPDRGTRKNWVTYGWCTGWKAWKSGEDGGYYEINMCAECLNRPFLETCGTLIHEMVHLQNIYDGVKDTSRGGTYHNKEFKRTAELHGLTVTKDKDGWHITILTDETAEWLKETYPDEVGFGLHRERSLTLTTKGGKQSTRKYVCPCCGTIIRATKQVNVTCTDCGVEFVESE